MSWIPQTLSEPIRWRAILIVDDAEADRATYRRYLAKILPTGCTILECDSGEEALLIAQTTLLDLIILDYRLPDLDGLNLMAQLAECCYPLPPLIMLTGQGNEAVAVQAMKQGAMDYLIKGELTAELLARSLSRVHTQQHLQIMIQKQQVQQHLMAETAQRISQSLELEEILAAAVEGLRELLKCDRTLIYRFDPDMSGTVIAESVTPPWTTSLGNAMTDPCFQREGAQRYLQGHRTVIDNIYESGLTLCHIQQLEQFEVKANLVVPILVDRETPQSPRRQRLWGLLIAHHCATSRHWDMMDLTSLDDLAVKLAIAIQQAELVFQLKQALQNRQTVEEALQDRANQLERVNTVLTRTSQLLQERNQELDDFAYIASHDLKAPLRAISNLSQWLEEDLADQLSAPHQHQLQLLRSRVLRMESMIEGVLQYSRLGRQEINHQPVNTTRAIHEVLDSLDPPNTFEITLPAKSYLIETDQLLLQRVLSNLISNAIKYHNRPEGHIQVNIIDQGYQLRFSVSDDGPGIDPEFHQQIFGLFQTLQSRDRVESTGIGLTIVKKIVERQGGNLGIMSQRGQGSTFWFTWPKG